MTKRFFQLKFGDKFALAGKILQKESAFRAVRSLGPRVEVAVWPWMKVRLVEDADMTSLCRGLREIDSRTRASYWPGRAISRRSTHFIGDGCFPPHEEMQLDAYKEVVAPEAVEVEVLWRGGPYWLATRNMHGLQDVPKTKLLLVKEVFFHVPREEVTYKDDGRK